MITNNQNIGVYRNSIFKASSSLHPPIFLLSSSYRSRINPVSIPYRNTETIRKQYGIDTGPIRKWWEMLRSNKGKLWKYIIQKYVNAKIPFSANANGVSTCPKCRVEDCMVRGRASTTQQTCQGAWGLWYGQRNVSPPPKVTCDYVGKLALWH